MNLAEAVRFASEMPWAMLPAHLVTLLNAARWPESHAPQAAARSIPPQAAGVAVLPVVGTILPRANPLLEFFGVASVDGLTQRFRAAVADPSIGSIVLDVDSPGGSVGGVDQLSAEIFASRGAKPIIAVANHLAASAAYWVATAADKLVVTPSAEVGSIGVFAAHQDVSGALDQMGVKISLISAGKYKVEGNPYQPLTDEARAAIQARVDEHYDAFVKAIARNRGVKASDVRGGFGEGRVVGAREAVSLGMADRVSTLDETVRRLARGGGQRSDREYRQRRARADEHM